MVLLKFLEEDIREIKFKNGTGSMFKQVCYHYKKNGEAREIINIPIKNINSAYPAGFYFVSDECFTHDQYGSLTVSSFFKDFSLVSVKKFVLDLLKNDVVYQLLNNDLSFKKELISVLSLVNNVNK